MSERDVETSTDIDTCAQEPIHVPGSIQPSGALFVVEEASGTIIARAVPGHWREAVQPFNDARTISDVGGPELHERITGLAESEGTQRIVDLELGGLTFEVFAHATKAGIVLELECQPGAPEQTTNVESVTRRFLDKLSAAETTDAVLALAARTVRELSDYDRVLIYRFEHDWSGTVVAEDRNNVLPSYLHHRFPASDIPEQARELYRVNRTRIIADANYEPIPLIPPVAPATGAPFDLTHAFLRSVSPVHIRYMRNMGTEASMSVSILREGRLWGLISCHNHRPRHVSHSTRSACDFIAQILAIRIASIEATDYAEDRRRLSHGYSELLASMAKASDFSEGLVARPDDLLNLTRAAGAAVVTPERLLSVGETPPPRVVRRIVGWLASHAPPNNVFVTDSLPHDMTCDAPDASERDAMLRETASGLLAVSISQLHDSFVLWFKPEVVRTVTWGGNPNEPKKDLSPRASFEAWREVLRGRSTPWQASEVDAAEDLQRAIVEIVLRNAEELAAMNERLVAANKELEAFSYSISHDLRAPFRHIVGFAQLLKERDGGTLSDRGKHYVETIIGAAISAGKLVDDLLQFSQMGRVTLNPISVDMTTLVDEIRTLVEPGQGERDIEWIVHDLPDAHADLSLVRNVLQNLIENALKFSSDRATATIEIGGDADERETTYFVKDNGSGFDMAFVGKLFGVFQRLHRVEDFEGTGIGLANVKRIIERHGGRVWAEGELDAGATFYFSLPRDGELDER